MSHSKLPALDEALRQVLENGHRLGTERVPLADAMGRVLAEDVASDMHMPPFNKSAMDGYACRRADLEIGELHIIETIPAGRAPTRTVGPGECACIMTGAPVPDGADCVIPVEQTERLTSGTAPGEAGFRQKQATVAPSCREGASPNARTNQDTVRIVNADTHDNICRRGEDIHAGDVVLKDGALLAPQHIGILATVGCSQPRVARQPRVAVLTTGDEIVEPDATPQHAQIRNSNGPQLCAQVRRAGGIPVYCGIAPDSEEGLDRAIKSAVASADVLIASGGVSMGDFDLVPGVLKANGFDLRFQKIAVKPGMPTVFGVAQKALCFGLPGNPVSTFIIFELLVRPLLMALMGNHYRPRTQVLLLSDDVHKRKTGRDTWLPVETVAAGEVRVVAYHGSGHLEALARADGLICIPSETRKLAKGTPVDVRPI